MRIISLTVDRFGSLEDVKLAIGGEMPRDVASEPALTKATGPRRPAARKAGATRTRKEPTSSKTLFAEKPAATAGAGFTLIHGPNEAGKTTLLRAIRYLLLGDDRTSSGKRATSAAMGESPSVRAIIELGSGSSVEIHRRKSKPGWVGRMLASGDEAPEDWFMAAIGHPDASLFRNVFAFSIDELARGSQELEKGHLGGLMFGSGLGGMIRPAAVLTDLEAAKSALFIEKGHKQAIVARHNRIEALKTELRGATTTSEELERLDLAIAEKQRAVDEAKSTILLHSEEKERLNALASALEPFADYRMAKAELEALGPVPSLPGTARAELASARSTRAQAIEDLERQEVDKPAIARELASLVIDTRLLEAAGDIEALDRGLGTFVEAERELRARAGERDGLLRRIERRLGDLATDLGLLRLRELAVSREVRARLTTAADDVERIGHEAREAAAVAKASRVDREALLRERAALPPETDVRALRGWIEEAAQSAGARELLETLDADVARHRRAEAVLRAKLDPAPTGDDPALVAMPRAEEIDAFDRYLNDHEENLRRADRDVARADEELAAMRFQVAEMRAGGEVPTEAELVHARERRGIGWNLVARALQGHLDVRAEVEFDSKEPLAKSFERAMLEADDLVDRMRFRADAVQRRAQKEAAAIHLEEELDRLVDARNAALAEQATASAAWIALWHPAGIAPRMPAVMRAWLADRERWLSVREQLEVAIGARVTVAERLDACALRGRALLGIDGELAVLRAEAERRVFDAAAREATRARIEATLARLDETIARADERGRELETAMRSAEETFAAAWTRVDVGGPVAPKLAVGLLDELLRLRDSWLETEEEQDERRLKLESQTESYLARLEVVRRRLGLSESAAAIEAEVEGLRNDLARSREAARRASELEERLARIAADDTRRRTLLSRADTTLRELRERAGVDSDEALERVIDAAERAGVLERTAADAERTLARVRGPFTEREFHEAVAGTNMEAIAADQRALEAKRGLAASAHEARLEELVTLRNERARLDGSERAAELYADVSAERAALRSDVENFAVLALAEAVLKKSIEEFERTNQPALVSEASSLFSRMTSGRYVSVRATAQREIFVERETGERRSPEELSTGTNEQLFFALRLAYVTLYGTRAEPLPVVLDDILVNFDRDRAAATLAALGSFSSRTQVLFFTCHAHLVDLVREVLPAASVLSL